MSSSSDENGVVNQQKQDAEIALAELYNCSSSNSSWDSNSNSSSDSETPTVIPTDADVDRVGLASAFVAEAPQSPPQSPPRSATVLVDQTVLITPVPTVPSAFTVGSAPGSAPKHRTLRGIGRWGHRNKPQSKSQRKSKFQPKIVANVDESDGQNDLYEMIFEADDDDGKNILQAAREAAAEREAQSGQVTKAKKAKTDGNECAFKIYSCKTRADIKRDRDILCEGYNCLCCFEHVVDQAVVDQPVVDQPVVDQPKLREPRLTAPSPPIVENPNISLSLL